MPEATWSFEVTYWGTTGSFPRALTPYDVSRKVARTIRQLHQLGRLEGIVAGAPSEDELIARIVSLVSIEHRFVHGGNTTCLEVRTPDSIFLVDAGSGLQAWARQFRDDSSESFNQELRRSNVLLTHAHLDHVCALAFADVFYDARNHFKIWATSRVINELRSILAPTECGRSLLAPVGWQQLRGIQQWNEFPSDGSLDIAGTRITPLALNHPGASTGFCFERNGKRIVIATDHEQEEVPDATLVRFAQGADLLYVDAQYLQCEYNGERGIGNLPPRARRGWGHSTVEASIATALAANVTELHLGHHDPHRSDADLDELEKYAQAIAIQLETSGNASGKCRIRLARDADRWTC